MTARTKKVQIVPNRQPTTVTDYFHRITRSARAKTFDRILTILDFRFPTLRRGLVQVLGSTIIELLDQIWLKH
jgi:hypothetical protein